MTMKHGLLPEDRPQDHGAVREASTVASLLDVLGDATRLAILRHLHGGEHRVVELTEHLGLAQSTVSQHLAILRSAGIAATAPSTPPATPLATPRATPSVTFRTTR